MKTKIQCIKIKIHRETTLSMIEKDKKSLRSNIISETEFDFNDNLIYFPWCLQKN